MSMGSYRAKAAVVKVSVGEASGNRIARIIRRGAEVPEGVDQDLLDSLAARGLIEPIEISDEPDEDVDDDEVFTGPPPKNAPRETWERYARHAGLADEEIVALKKPELIEAATAKASADQSGDPGAGDDGENGNPGDDDEPASSGD